MIKKKILSYVAAISIVVGSFCGVGIFFWIRNKNNVNKIEHKEVFNVKDNSMKMDVFPDLIKNDYYDFLRIKAGKPSMNDKFIAKVINDVVRNMKVTDGNLDLSWQMKSPEELVFIFRWVNMKQVEFWKTYDFKLNSNYNFE